MENRKTRRLLYSIAVHSKQVLLHKKNPDVGFKDAVYSSELYLDWEDAKDLSVDEEVTFMDWGNVIVKSVQWNQDKTMIDVIEIALHLEGDFVKHDLICVEKD